MSKIEYKTPLSLICDISYATITFVDIYLARNYPLTQRQHDNDDIIDGIDEYENDLISRNDYDTFQTQHKMPV